MVQINIKKEALKSQQQKQQQKIQQQLKQNQKEWEQILEKIQHRIQSQNSNSNSIENFHVGKKIRGLYYLPNFLTPEEHDALVNLILNSEKNWVQGEGRRIQNWGGKPSQQNITEKLPQFIQLIVENLILVNAHEKNQAPNHCLINDYSEGRGLPYHRDGPLYLPRVSTLTLCGSAIINFRKIQNQDQIQENYNNFGTKQFQDNRNFQSNSKQIKFDEKIDEQKIDQYIFDTQDLQKSQEQSQSRKIDQNQDQLYQNYNNFGTNQFQENGNLQKIESNEIIDEQNVQQVFDILCLQKNQEQFQSLINKTDQQIDQNQDYIYKNYNNFGAKYFQENRNLSKQSELNEKIDEQKIDQQIFDMSNLQKNQKQFQSLKIDGKTNQKIINQQDDSIEIAISTNKFEFYDNIDDFHSDTFKSQSQISNNNFENYQKQQNLEAVEKVLLQERGLLIMSGEACENYEHGIEDCKEDIIDENCCNREILNIELGAKIQRNVRRMSMVFVTKQKLEQQ